MTPQNGKNDIPELKTLENRCEELEKEKEGNGVELLKKTVAQIGRVSVWQIKQRYVTEDECNRRYSQVKRWDWKAICAIGPLWLMTISILITLFFKGLGGA